MKLEEMKALCDAATPGPWTYEAEEYAQTHMERGDIYDGQGLEVAQKCLTINAQFIAAARTLFPKVIDEKIKLRKAIEQIAKLEAVAEAAKRFSDCAAEFFPEYPDACSEYLDHLWDALAALEADP